MTTIIQIRHVPTDVHRRLKSKASLEGLSLSAYLLREVSLLADRPSVAELRLQLASRSSTDTSQTMAEAIRAERDSC